ncbi:MAG: molybdopterin cofactor-binding domain-containing protein [Imperialibacter sp.]|uniref:xanthine dehydrogenase family protein molybdopterin-binding subunit n=1 Tax=Imperialibacter sp. TaxID=2038411 RepID=UPI003A895860
MKTISTNTQERSGKLPRREFLRLTAVSGAFLAIGCSPGEGGENKVTTIDPAGGSDISLNQFVVINTNGRVLLYNHRPEMGQGTFQAIPMILAEELEVDVEQIEILPSAADEKRYGSQMVVGSRSIQTEYANLRNMGAAAREMLRQAAANRWQVEVSECKASLGEIIHNSGKKLTYGELVEEASKLTPPESPPLKAPGDFKVIGRSTARRDIPDKTNGAAVYGLDIQVPGMLYASVERSPVFLGKVISFNDEKAKAVPGVKAVVKTQRNVLGHTREGVAVVADNYWAANQGRKALEVKWDTGGLENNSSATILKKYKADAAKKGVSLAEAGDLGKSSGAASVVEAVYETPYQSHVCMEPMNATVSVMEGKAEFWGSTQNPNGIRSQLARQLNIDPENVAINYTFMGGGFGRRSMTDVAEEAADISLQVGAPVKVVWTREDDLTQGPFRAASLNVCRGTVAGGKVVVLEHKVVAQEIQNQTGDKMEAGRQLMGGINTEYEIPNFRISGVLQKHYVPITYWRAVYHTTNCFAHESFIDELAIAAGKNPLDFRLDMLKNHPRYTKVLQTLAEKTNWYGPKEEGGGRGVSILERSGAFTGMVIEVKKENGKVKPVKITTVVDVGICVNPDTVRAQTEGSIVMGLTATYKSGIRLENGAVTQSNFHDYNMLTFEECPPCETYIIQNEEKPEGAGESGLANVAPSLCNAIFDLTGVRVRKLPLGLGALV